MKKVFWDANIILDFMLAREPWNILAAEMFSKASSKELSLYCSTLSLATLSFYLEREKIPSEDIFAHIDSFISVCEPLPVDVSVAKSALKSSFKDFEDAMQYFAAMNEGCDIIITRDKRGFVDSSIPVMGPQEFLDKYHSIE